MDDSENSADKWPVRCTECGEWNTPPRRPEAAVAVCTNCSHRLFDLERAVIVEALTEAGWERRQELKELDRQAIKDWFLILPGIVILGLILWAGFYAFAYTWNLVTGSGPFYLTERVVTDMVVSPQWLDKEQKDCIYEKQPGDTGYLLCETASGFHNIPVKFYGMRQNGEDLKQPIRFQWKCVRNGNGFFCSDSRPLPQQ
jgi:hypothetical protein